MSALIAYVGRDLEVVSGQSLGIDLVPGVPELQQDAGHGVALLIRLLEESSRHDACSIDDESAGERNTVVRRGGVHGGIEESVGLDRGRPRVRQQRKCDASSP